MRNYKAITTEEAYNGLAINACSSKGQACITKVLDRYQAHLSDMTSKHCKVMQVRFDLRYPADGSVSPKSHHKSHFNYNLTRRLKRENYAGGHNVDPRIIIAPEKNSSEHQHLHGVILVNGNARQNYFSLLKVVEETWSNVLKTDAVGLVDYCNKNGPNGMILNRNADDFQDTLNKCSHQASYLAKVKDKDNNPKGSWLVCGTPIPKS